MKKSYILCWVLLFFWMQLPAQTIDYKAKIDGYVLNLNKSQIPTGILYDRVYPMAGLHKFNHAGSRDTSSYAHFKQAYFELYEAKYSTVSMQAFATFKTVINQSLVSKRIPIGAIHYNFNIIDTLALRNNLLSIQNELLYDVASRPRIPYLPHQTLVVAALTESVQAGTVNFVFNSNFIKSNTGNAITSINVDFGNETGTTATIVPGSTVYTAYYGGEGLKTLRYTVYFSNGTQQTTYSTLKVNGFASNNSCYNCSTAANYKPCNPIAEVFESTLAFQGYDETTATKSKAEVSYYYANCSSPVLRKPLLLLDGFDPGKPDQEKICTMKIWILLMA